MATLARRNAPLGDLVVAAFDKASFLSADPREISRLAAQDIARAVMKEWATASVQRRAGWTETGAAWTRLLFQCAVPPVALLGRVTGALGRGVIGGRATW